MKNDSTSDVLIFESAAGDKSSNASAVYLWADGTTPVSSVGGCRWGRPELGRHWICNGCEFTDMTVSQVQNAGIKLRRPNRW